MQTSGSHRDPSDAENLPHVRAHRSQGDVSAAQDAWSARVEQLWLGADEQDPRDLLETMRTLVDELPVDDPEALFEWASVHDFLGMEAQAIPLYRAALAAGLVGVQRTQAVIQLASSLRNTSEPDQALRLLENLEPCPAVGDAPRAFMALALHDLGRSQEALSVLLAALVPHLPMYGRALSGYGEGLRDQP